MFLYLPLAKKEVVIDGITVPVAGLPLHHRHAVLDAQLGLQLLVEEHPASKLAKIAAAPAVPAVPEAPVPAAPVQAAPKAEVEAPKAEVEAPKPEAEEAPKPEASEPSAEPRRRERKAD